MHFGGLEYAHAVVVQVMMMQNFSHSKGLEELLQMRATKKH